MVKYMKELYLAGGCFWRVQEYLRRIDGVIKTEVGYANGKTEHPTYEEVCKGSGHVEVVKVTYHPYQISLTRLLDFYYEFIQPTKLKRGQYRTGIYYTNSDDYKIISYSLKKLQTHYHRKIKIECLLLENYTKAEDYHQDYLRKHPHSSCQISNNKLQMIDAENNIKRKPMSFYVTKEKKTEPPFLNAYWNYKEEGIYVDIDTNMPLFSSKDKFPSDCGWPCFTKPIDEHCIQKKLDLSHFMIRTEVISKSSHNHLGHVFQDGPEELGGKRYCINSAALKFISKEKMKEAGFTSYLDKL